MIHLGLNVFNFFVLYLGIEKSADRIMNAPAKGFKPAINSSSNKNGFKWLSSKTTKLYKSH